jgi:formylglycine-generating enzyme required for sulfatase activity
LIWASSSPYDWGLHWNSGASKWEPAPGCAIRPVIRVTWYGAKAFAEWAGGSLPTEAQWEYACRAGTTTAYSYGAAANGNYMWYDSNSGSVTHDVGLKQPNPWGLYDMHGNVFEWCSDWYVDYGSAAATDPTGATSGSNRVLRGGDWYYDAEDCRSANRLSDPPGSSSLSYGFRVVWVQ